MSNSPPFMKILSPFEQIYYQVGEQIDFIGEAFDLESFQALPGSDTYWVSSIDGPLGVGYEITSPLSAGGKKALKSQPNPNWPRWAAAV